MVDRDSWPLAFAFAGLVCFLMSLDELVNWKHFVGFYAAILLAQAGELKTLRRRVLRGWKDRNLENELGIDARAMVDILFDRLGIGKMPSAWLGEWAGVAVFVGILIVIGFF